jgi:hypothetical protein
VKNQRPSPNFFVEIDKEDSSANPKNQEMALLPFTSSWEESTRLKPLQMIHYS